MAAYSGRVTTGRQRSAHRGLVVHAADIVPGTGEWRTACGIVLPDPEHIDADTSCVRCLRLVEAAYDPER